MRLHLKTVLATGLIWGGLLLAGPALAALKVGQTAPDFQTEASLDGKPFTFSLAKALKTGPVVLYFYPKAFTKGCTLEAHAFAEATPTFQKMGAQVIGISHDDLETLHKFSVSECRSQFAVGSDPDGKVIKAYDAKLTALTPHAARTTYVIAPDGKIIMEFTAMSPEQHVSRSLAAVEAWKGRQK